MMKITSREAGFSLIEVLISLAIALVAIVAATALYSGTKQTYRVQEMQNRLTEDGRFAISMLQRVISQAGFRPTPATVWSPWTADAELPPSAFVIPTSATSVMVRFIGDGVNQINCSGAPVGSGVKTSLAISLSGNDLVCGTETWIDSSGSGNELISFALEYGSDTVPDTDSNFGCGPAGGTLGTRAGDCVADTYNWAIANGARDRIVAVRACLVLRSRTTDASINKSAAYKDCGDVDIADSQTDKKLYRTFRTTVLLRNR
jgi:type IV pilus assembly protein PilW